jgi:hypothetical protein
MKELDNNIQNTLEKINEICIKIAIKDDLNVKFNKLDFLNEKGFYDKYNPKMFL